jgi:hypothetical protein
MRRGHATQRGHAMSTRMRRAEHTPRQMEKHGGGKEGEDGGRSSTMDGEIDGSSGRAWTQTAAMARERDVSGIWGTWRVLGHEAPTSRRGGWGGSRLADGPHTRAMRLTGEPHTQQRRWATARAQTRGGHGRAAGGCWATRGIGQVGRGGRGSQATRGWKRAVGPRGGQGGRPRLG